MWGMQWRLADCFRQQRFPEPIYGSDATIALAMFMAATANGATMDTPGIGDWTAHYIAMRALRWPDAFPAGDVALHKALGVQSQPKAQLAAETLSQAWRPWRSYAVLRAWNLLATPDTPKPKGA